MPDAAYGEPRLAAMYDVLDPDRSDLEAYVGLATELDARSVLDVGCGTGVFALLLADRGLEVIGVDPAHASVDVARGKPGADRVIWIDGDATTLPPLQVDLATMTANVAQVFLTDDAWDSTLRGIHAALRPGGHLVFETRDPARRAWEDCTPERTRTETDVPGEGRVVEWMEVLSVDGAFVSFRSHNELPDGTDLVSDTTLRFRTHEELDRSLVGAGFEVREVRDAPDRPGREFVYVARRTG